MTCGAQLFGFGKKKENTQTDVFFLFFIGIYEGQRCYLDIVVITVIIGFSMS